MADKTSKTVKIPDDIEYRVIGNFFGLLIASAGILGGNMVNQRSIDYWMEDLLPLLMILFFLFRLYRTTIATVTLYQKPLSFSRNSEAERVYNENLSPGGTSPRIAAQTISPQKVVEEVAKRIEAKKEAAQKKNKMINPTP